MTADEEQPLRVAVLGPVRAWRGDTELELGAPQRRAVLGLLAVRANQVVARDELIDGQRLGQVEQAIDCFKQALALFREIGDRTGEAEALNGVGEIMLAAGRPQEARAGHAAALTLTGQTGDAYEQARAHAGLGAALSACGDVTVGTRHLLRALGAYAEIGAPEPEDIRARLAALDAGQAHEPAGLAPR